MSTPLLELRGLSGGYQPIQIFQNVDLTVEQGASIGFFGPNGHGKTTLMKTISGVLEPWRGDVIFEGQRLNRAKARGSRRWRNFNYDVVTPRRMDPKTVARAGLIHVPQGNLLFPEMTVEETLSIAPLVAAERHQSSAHESALHEKVGALFPRLQERRNHKNRFLSGGERQMVSIAAGLLADPKLLILDEPTLGLSPKLRLELCEAIKTIRAAGVPLIVIDQDIGFLTELIDVLYLFDHGSISRRLERAEIPSHDQLMAMLFGEAV
ncbi:ABC transporter ATP-binding protein [Pelagibius sp. Alg239-R121]|uniref:ABC transporter ATP-binding protein n=1 Tax=Pelagibius sp. Alg239-R121 TaxID=2993448 RepID=UPI0024A77992|nr:ATP-binding cassette domain-containing protein [Pelagibius sp. Alg239-R121]